MRCLAPMVASNLCLAAPPGATTGALTGTVLDGMGRPRAGVKVCLRQEETGFSRMGSTGPDGTFGMAFLPPGPYQLRVDGEGRGWPEIPVQVSLGETRSLRLRLPEAGGAEVAVLGPALDATRIQTPTGLDLDEAETLPLPGWGLPDLVLLAPGASLNAEGYRPTVEGARGIHSTLVVDGMSFGSLFFREPRGSTRLPSPLPLDALQEVRVVTGPLDASQGDAGGAVLQAVTRRGTNTWQGRLRWAIRPSWGTAAIQPAPAALDRLETPRRTRAESTWSATVGGPLVKDRLHLFLGVEHSCDAFQVRPTLAPGAGGNSMEQQARFFAPEGMGPGLVTRPGGVTLAAERGEAWTFRREARTVTARLDLSLPGQRLALRMHHQAGLLRNGTYTTPRLDLLASGNSTHRPGSRSWVLEHQVLLDDRGCHEVRVQVAGEDHPVVPNTFLCPQIQVGAGSATLTAGQSRIDPRDTRERLVQVQQMLTWVPAGWELKGGLDLQFYSLENRYLPAARGAWDFSTFAAANAWWAGAAGPAWPTGQVTYQQGVSPLDGRARLGCRFHAAFLQAQRTGLLEDRLRLELGLRGQVQRWSGNPAPNPSLVGLDHMPDARSLDPHGGLVLSLGPATVIRAGVGWASLGHPGQTVAEALMDNGINRRSYRMDTGDRRLVAAFLAGGPLSAGCCVRDGILQPLGAGTLAGFEAEAVEGTLLDPETRMTRVETRSVGVERALGHHALVGIRGVWKTFRHLQSFLNVHLGVVDAGTGQVIPDLGYRDGYPAGTRRFSQTVRPARVVVRGRVLDLSGFGDVGLSRAEGRGDYRGLTLRWEYRAPDHWGLRTHATWSRSRDDNSNERATALSPSAQPADPADPGASFGLADGDRPFRGLVMAWLPPWRGLRASLLFTWSSGLPWTATWGDDLNGDGLRIDPAEGIRNGHRQPPERSLDLRLAYALGWHGGLRLEVAAEVVNLLDGARRRTGRTDRAPRPGAPLDPRFGAYDRPDSRTRECQATVRVWF